MPRIVRRCVVPVLLLLSAAMTSGNAQADLLVTNFFFNTVDRYNDQTGDLIQTGFMAAPTETPEDPLGLAGLVVNPTDQQVFVSGRLSDRIYVFDGLTGAPLSASETPSGIEGVFLELTPGVQPAGLTLDSAGQLYVANNGGSTIDVFDSSTGAAIKSISDPLLNMPSGLTFDAGGDLFITNLSGTGTLRYDGSEVTEFAPPTAAGPFVPNGLIVDPTGQVYVPDVYSNGIYKYDAGGTEIPGESGPFINIDPDVPEPSVPDPSTEVDAPSGLLFDQEGNILVAALGPTNPGEGDLNGALLRYSPDGTLLQTLGTKLPPASAVAFAPVEGDFNNDHDADGADFLLWQRDQDVGSLAAWQAGYGSPTEGGTSAAVVPEPATLSLLLISCVGVGAWRRREI